MRPGLPGSVQMGGRGPVGQGVAGQVRMGRDRVVAVRLPRQAEAAPDRAVTVRRLRSGALELFRVADERRGRDLLEDRDAEAGQKAGDQGRREDPSIHGWRILVTGKGEGVAAVMRGVVNGLRMGKTGAEEEKDAEENGDCRRDGNAGLRRIWLRDRCCVASHGNLSNPPVSRSLHLCRRGQVNASRGAATGDCPPRLR